jgi:N-acyl-D-aspartate/D-glutamate deacylase
VHELVIKGARIVDGTGAEPFSGDVAVDGGRISAVGTVSERGREELDADGLLLTPGFVDIHTHYDAQATWDPHLLPSGGHGVTTAVCGNCGVGFAPAAPDRHQWLIGLMEGVEDIPGAALAEGIRWEWESFPEYLDALERFPRAVDLGTQVPHGAVRAYVMGERGAKNEAATAEDIQQMYAIVREGLEAGALGFSTSRTLGHRAVDGEPVPGSFAQEDELFGIGQALADVGQGVFELAPAGAAGDTAMDDVDDALREIDWMHRLSAAIRRPVAFAMLQFDARPDQWRELLEICRRTRVEGANVRAQIAARPFGVLAGLQTVANPFLAMPSYREIAHLPLAERVARMRDPEYRQRILSEEPRDRSLGFASLFNDEAGFAKLFPIGDPPDYEPTADQSILALARREGRSPKEVLYDHLLRDDGRELLLLPLMNYSDGNSDAQREMLMSDETVVGLGDGGAHCGLICDASLTTYMLTHWVRDRSRGPRIPLEYAVRRMTQHTAQLYGLDDRGVVAAGYKADFNLIDFDNLTLRRPRMAHDLPAGARRLLQEADGYEATIVSGEVIMRGGEPTEARPGRLVRGAQRGPA